MSWFLLKMLGAGRWLLELVSAIGRWMLADWRNGPLLVFALAFAAHVFVIEPGLREDLRKSEAALKAASEAHQETIDRYRQAVTEARRRAEMNVARVETEQAEITREIVDDFETRLADARARADRLARSGRLHQLEWGPAPAGTAGSSAGAAGVSGVPAAPGQAGESAGEDRLPSPGELSGPDALIATEQALQLQALIEWVNRQAAVQVAPEATDVR